MDSEFLNKLKALIAENEAPKADPKPDPNQALLDRIALMEAQVDKFQRSQILQGVPEHLKTLLDKVPTADLPDMLASEDYKKLVSLTPVPEAPTAPDTAVDVPSGETTIKATKASDLTPGNIAEVLRRSISMEGVE